MRKLLLLSLAVMFSFMTFAQKEVVQVNKKAILTDLKKVKVLKRSESTLSKFEIGFGTPIGLTNYDLQTNSSGANRLIRHSDGTMSAVWIQDQSATPGGATRGTGYAYFNGSSWDYNELSGNNRVEAERTGWGNLLSNGTEEFVVSHYRSAGGLFGYKQTKGAAGDTWTAAPLTGGPEPMLWPRTASSGDNYYAIAVDDYASDPYTEIEALHFYKSENAGETWSYEGKMPNFNNYYFHANGDVYQIDASGDIVAVVYFGEWGDIRLWKSVDKGENWTETVINDFPVDNYNGTAGTKIDMDSDNIADTIMTCDGTGDVVIDHTGKVHVVFSRMRVLDEDASDDGASSYFPYTDWILYWNEDMGPGVYSGVTSPSFIDLAVPAEVDTVGFAPDLNANGQYDFVDAGTELPFGKYYTSLSTFPSIGVDASNNIYLAFSTVMEGTDYAKTDATPNAQQFRGLYLSKRNTNGVWGDIVNISDVDGQQAENVFPMMARDVDGFVYLTSQWDGEPGLHIRGDEDGTVTDNYIIYKAVDVSDIPTGVEQVSDVNVVIYPNPTSTILNVSVKDLQMVELYSVLGQLVLTTNTNQLNIEKLPKGTYILKVYSNSGIATKKIQKI